MIPTESTREDEPAGNSRDLLPPVSAVVPSIILGSTGKISVGRWSGFNQTPENRAEPSPLEPRGAAGRFERVGQPLGRLAQPLGDGHDALLDLRHLLPLPWGRGA